MLFTRTRDEIFALIYQDITENTPITNLGESSTARMIVESIASRFSELYATVEVYHNSAYLSTATGEHLDRIGELHGVVRRSSMRAFSGESSFRFYIDPATGYTITDLVTISNSNGANVTDITINQGTTITAGSGVSYTTTAPIALTNAGTFVNVIAGGTGREFNVGPGALVRHNISSNQLDLYSISNFILCTNDEAIETGVNFESDSSYRARIFEGRLSNLNGNEVAIRTAALSVPGVSNIILNKYPEGVGTYNLVVMTEYPVAATAILNAVEEAVTQVASYGTRAIVSTPEYLSIELKLKLHFQPRAQIELQETIKRDVRVAVIDYTNNLPVGGSWIVNEVIQQVMQVSDLIRDTEQQWFRVHRYFLERQVLADGKGQGKSEVNQLQLSEGSRMIWTNQRCRVANPPQKFLMLGKHLVIC